MVKFSVSNVPIKISPCPIKEAVFELRFETDKSPEIIPGILYSKLSSEFSKVERSPILEMPQIIRDSEPGLMYAPHHIFHSDLYKLQVGPKSVSLVCPDEYVGWTHFQNKICSILDVIDEIKLVKKATRTGLRYVNVFEEENIFENIKIGLSIDENPLIKEGNSIASEFQYSDFLCVLKISNQHLNAAQQQTSMIDIDIIRDLSDLDKPDFKQIVLKSHDIEKTIFFSLLKEDYLKNKYNPEYGGQ